MDLLKRLKQLASSGNERFILLNETGDDGFVLLPLSAYESLISPLPSTLNHQPSPPEHILASPPIAAPSEEEFKITVKIGKPDQSAKLSQKFEDEEKFYLEPLR